tara:strand:+ start:6934 stop:8130 length:1197 start_codon:yes stop_codon:yes gene_type:complete
MYDSLYYAYAVFGFSFAYIGVAVQFQLVDEYHTSPAQNAYAWAIISVPWVLKPVYGLISDKFPLFGYRRSYISASSFVCGVLFAYTPSLATGRISLVTALTCCSLFMCVADVGCDAVMVELTKSETAGTQGHLQSGCWMARTLGSLFGSGLSGITYNMWGFGPVVRLAALPVLFLSVYIWNLQEHRKTDNETQTVLVTAFRSCLRMWRMLLFLLISAVVPEISSVLWYKLRSQGVDPLGMSVISLAGAVAACCAAFVYQFWRGFRSALVASLLLGVLSTMVAVAIALGAPAFQFAILRSVLNSVASIFFVLPVVIYTAKHCPEGAEGTTYSMVMSWMNLVGILSETVEGATVRAVGITETNLQPLATFCMVSVVLATLPLCSLHLVREKTSEPLELAL